MTFVFDPPKANCVQVSDGRLFPVRRIYCIGRNYAEHAREMGADPDREPPFFFTKWADTIVVNPTEVIFPTKTSNYHFEAEMVVALDKGGHNIPEAQAEELVFGYGVGLDMTRRDLQGVAKKMGRPWDIGKNVDHSAPIATLHPKSEIGTLNQGEIWLELNGERRQHSDLCKMIWSVSEMISILSEYYTLSPGDLIFTGTPEGVGPVEKGDQLSVHVEGLTDLNFKLV